MPRDAANVTVRDNHAETRYEAIVDGHLSMIEYDLRGQTIIFTHTGVPEALEGRGIASAMTRFALDDARTRGLVVVPQCPFVAGYIRQHPEYQDLVRH